MGCIMHLATGAHTHLAFDLGVQEERLGVCVHSRYQRVHLDVFLFADASKAHGVTIVYLPVCVSGVRRV